jgi:hypothetical protein
MPHDQPVPHGEPPRDTAAQLPDTLAREPVEDGQDWFDDQADLELPRRPRRRLLTPVPLVLTGVLLIACGFIAGALVEKGQSSSSSSGSSGGVASRFAALRSGAAGGASARAGSGSGTAGFAGGSGAAGGAGAGGAGATIGQVAYVSGDTLYVTDAEGNTVKVTTSAASTVTKAVKAEVKAVHPGETVIVTGSPGTSGSISAESIRVGEAGGGLGALFGGRSRGGGARGASGEPALFGG